MKGRLIINALTKYVAGLILVGPILLLKAPVELGSWIAFVLFLHYPILIAMRIKNEEMVLE